MSLRPVPYALALLLLCGCPTQSNDDDSVADDDDTTFPDDDDSGIGGVLLTGDVTRTVDSVGDGIGSIVVALFDEDPGGGEGPSKDPVAFGKVTGVDLTASDASVPYGLGGIPLNAGTLWVGAFFDEDDPDGEVETASPANGDLINFDLMNGGGPTITVGDDTTISLDIVFNEVVQF